MSGLLPDRLTLKSVREAAAGCKACDLYTRGTQTTVHPSSILRAPDDESRRSEMQRFVEDLRKVITRL